MANWQNYWRIVTPQSRKSAYDQPLKLDDGQNLNTAGHSFATVSWFSNLLKGAASRLQRYKQYDAMDSGDVARALDTIAEEISNPDRRTDLPFQIEYQTEEDQNISDAATTTIRAALRHWSNFQQLNRRTFDIARTMAKYGDCFFRKRSDTKKWEYVDPTRVVGIEINPETTEIVAYHIRPAAYQQGGVGLKANIAGRTDLSIEIIPAIGMIHFSLSTEMGESMPFGISLLQPAYHDYQKLMMLENAAIIYRIVRAPERRVFYIDVGNMPAQRVKQYLDQIKNDLRQKRQPNTSNMNQTDSAYNPECLALDTKIPLLDGRTLMLSELIEEYQKGKVNWAYSVCPDTGKSAPGIITWAGVTRENAKRIKLTLDNGKEIIVTPDHKFPVQGKGFIEAQHISPNDSLFPFTKRNKVMYGKSDYEQMWDSESKSFIFTHRMVHDFMRDHECHTIFNYKNTGVILSEVIHHLDYDRFNNTPSNLVLMDAEDHNRFHRETKKEWWDNLSDDRRAQVCAAIAAGTKATFEKMPADVRAAQIEKATNRIRAYHHANKIGPTEKYTEWLASSSARIAALSNLEYIRQLRSKNGKLNSNLPENQSLQVSQEAISRMVEIIKHNDSDKFGTMSLLENDDIFMSIFRNDNVKTDNKVSRINGNRITDKYLKKAYSFISVKNWKEFKEVAQNYNHKVVAITEVENDDVGTITIDGREKFHNYHTFALDAGVYTKNSIQEDFFFPTTAAGRGSRVETLPGGTTWETPELDHFQNKVFRALRVPSSYMKGSDAAGAQYNDGKVGIAYIEELRFANFIIRLQTHLEDVFDAQFKAYLNTVGINFDNELFKLKLPDPQNFALYRQAALDADLINAFKAIEDTKYLSKRFMMKRYLGLTEDDIQMNETMLKQERDIVHQEEATGISETQQMYDPAVYESREPITAEPPGGSEEPGAEPAPEDIAAPDEAPTAGGVPDEAPAP